MQTTGLNPRTLRRIIGTVWGLLLIVLAVVLAMRIPKTVEIFVTAAVIALGVHPVTQFLERWMKRGLAITSVYLVIMMFVALIGLLVIPTGLSQTQAVLGALPDQMTSAEQSLVSFQTNLEHHVGKGMLPPSLIDIRSVIDSKISEWGTAAVAGLYPALVSTIGVMFVLLSAIILSIFFLASGERIRQQLLSIVPHSREHEVAQVLDEIVHIFGGFVAGQSILCAIVGVSTWLILWAFGYKFALLVGVLCGIAYAVPFVGMIVAQVIAAVLAAPQGLAMVWEVTIVVFVISRIADNVLVPKIMAPHVGVSPIAVMFGVFAGGELLGLPGLILGIPAAAMGKVLWRIFVRPWLSRHDFGPRSAEHEHEHQLHKGEREIDIEIHETIRERT
ncbi:MAG TPA: AI-2E family transporter [Candidatus Baltobacteraceae bacterium]